MRLLWLVPLALLCLPPARAEVYGPPWLEPAVAYYHGFESPLEQPEANAAGLAVDPSARQGAHSETAAPLAPVDEGFLGKGLSIGGWQAPLLLRGAALSPHRPLTLSFWWALEEDLPIDGGFELFALSGGGLVSHFVRGKGEWCALQRPTGVFQVYYFAGIQNVNNLYDPDLAAHLALTRGAWHHETVVFRRAQEIQVYTDGEPVCQVALTGREFAESDNLTTLTIGGPVRLDELMVLDRAIEPDQVAEYHRGMRRIREYVAGDG